MAISEGESFMVSNTDFPVNPGYRAVKLRTVTADNPGVSCFADLYHIKIAVREAPEVYNIPIDPLNAEPLEDRHMEGNRFKASTAMNTSLILAL